MLFYVQTDDKPGVLAGLEARAEEHWSYMDGFADRLVLRGPTLSPDGEEHTGSLHVVEVDDRAAAERFADEEPYWRAGYYEPPTIARAVVLVDRKDGVPKSLVTAHWTPAQLAESDGSDSLVSAVSRVSAGDLASTDDRVSFLAVLVDDAGARSIGLAAAVEALPDEAAKIVRPLADRLLGGAAELTARRWQRGGRS